MKIARFTVGLTMIAAALAAFLLDAHVAWRQSTSVHLYNQIAAGCCAVSGIAIAFPSVFTALLNAFARVSDRWPGGRRRTDPEAKPNVKPPE